MYVSVCERDGGSFAMTEKLLVFGLPAGVIAAVLSLPSQESLLLFFYSTHEMKVTFYQASPLEFLKSIQQVLLQEDCKSWKFIFLNQSQVTLFFVQVVFTLLKHWKLQIHCVYYTLLNSEYIIQSRFALFNSVIAQGQL